MDKTRKCDLMVQLLKDTANVREAKAATVEHFNARLKILEGLLGVLTRDESTQQEFGFAEQTAEQFKTCPMCLADMKPFKHDTAEGLKCTACKYMLIFWQANDPARPALSAAPKKGGDKGGKKATKAA